MTEFSMLWETQTGVGDGTNSYTEDQANFFFQDYTIAENATMGVLSGIDNELVVTGTVSPLALDTGKAICYGFRYKNDASLNLAVTTPSIGDTGGRLVLTASWASNTVRAAILANTDGNPALPALTQVAGTTWQISIASFVTDTSGNIWTDASKTVAGTSDTRSFALTPLAGMIKLREYTGDGTGNTITFNYIQQDLTNLRIVGRWLSTTGGGLNFDVAFLRFNGDAGANYSNSLITLHNTVTGGSLVAQNSALLIPLTSALVNANAGDPFTIDIPVYRGVLYKSALSPSAALEINTTPHIRFTTGAGWWLNTADITRIDLVLNVGNFATGTKVSLYGYR